MSWAGTGGIGAVADGFALGAVSRRPTNRAALRHDELSLVSISPLGDDLNYLGDHIASALHDDSVADANVLAPNFILVVERSPADDDTADINGLEHGQRRQCARAADIDDDVVDAGSLLRCRELVGRGPARFPRNETQFLLLAEVVDFDNDPVDFERQ